MCTLEKGVCRLRLHRRGVVDCGCHGDDIGCWLLCFWVNVWVGFGPVSGRIHGSDGSVLVWSARWWNTFLFVAFAYPGHDAEKRRHDMAASEIWAI